MTDPDDQITKVLAELRRHLDADAEFNIGFPSTFAFDYSPVLPFFADVLNNVGDPFTESAYPRNTKHLEREVIDFFADLLRAPADDRWGYVTTGGTEGVHYGLWLARTLLPDSIAYYSSAAHYSVKKCLDLLRMPAVAIRADRWGVLDYDDLRAALAAHRHRPAVVLATAGTTMTEAVDDTHHIRAILADIPIPCSYVHVDAALSGLTLPFQVGTAPHPRPGFDLADGADSISVSGHKQLGMPFPAGVVITRHSLRHRVGASVDYVATFDTTLSGSRNGHAPLLLWYALKTLGLDGLRDRAEESLRVAAYAVDALTRIGWRAWRHPTAITVVLDTPPEPVRVKWRLASSNGQSHLITVPGVTTGQLDKLAVDLAATLPAIGSRLVRQHAAPDDAAVTTTTG